MRETAALAERVANLQGAVEKLGILFEKAIERQTADHKERLGELKSDLKEVDGKVSGIEKKVEFVKGAMWVMGGLFALALVILGAMAGKLPGQ